MATTTAKDTGAAARTADNGKSPTTEDLSNQIEQLKSDLGSLTQLLTDLTRTKGDELAKTVRARAETVRETGEAQLAELQRRAIDSAETAEEYVRRNPATALGIAAGFGLLVGLITARR